MTHLEDVVSARPKMGGTVSGPIVVLEGPDGSGKTTLGTMVEDIIGQVRPVGERIDLMRAPKLDSVTGSSHAVTRWWQNQLEFDCGPRLYDRCTMISEMVYTPIRNTEPNASSPELGWLWELASRRDILFVMCQPSWQQVKENLAKDEVQLEGMNERRWELVVWQYQAITHLLIHSNFKVWTYDWWNFAPTVSVILNHLQVPSPIVKAG